jgi:hypothetical protein
VIIHFAKRHLTFHPPGRVVQRFDPELNDRQRLILDLLGIAPDEFTNL